MKELDENTGKIYVKDDFYYLEKIYTCLAEMIKEEAMVKRRAERHHFKVVETDWIIEDNPFYYIETILDETGKTIDKNRYRYKLKLEYKK
tara:strand:- start:691 stop:960 length:270 start_codon:yes stop_codon:yes gene_type:complete